MRWNRYYDEGNRLMEFMAFMEFMEERDKAREKEKKDKDNKPKSKTFTYVELFIILCALSPIIGPTQIFLWTAMGKLLKALM